VDVRLISATHQNLASCVEQGKFRQDLYYRLNVIELKLPPLRERRDDIDWLATVILGRLAAPGYQAVLAPAASEALRSYAFPGNVRELENILERALAFANHGVIEVVDLALKPPAQPAVEAVSVPAASSLEPTKPEPQPVKTIEAQSLAEVPPELPHSLPAHLDEVERQIIRRALAQTRFNRTQAAELLGISFRQLRYRMQRLAIREHD